jgi:hypothetical protein
MESSLHYLLKDTSVVDTAMRINLFNFETVRTMRNQIFILSMIEGAMSRPSFLPGLW